MIKMKSTCYEIKENLFIVYLFILNFILLLISFNMTRHDTISSLHLHHTGFFADFRLTDFPKSVNFPKSGFRA